MNPTRSSKWRMPAVLAAAVLLLAAPAVAQTTRPDRTGLLTDARYLLHDTGPGHPERPGRLTAIVAALGKAGLIDRCVPIQPRFAELEWIRQVHTPQYVEQLAGAWAAGKRRLTSDTPIGEQSYRTALLAAGGCLSAVDAVAAGRVRNAFCLVRPPGHHAMADRGMGFCLFNNVAVAARYAQKKYGWKRVFIVDWDVHHGNGTQAIFESDPTVFYFGTHQWPFYPGTGAANETGKGPGKGSVLNVPLAAGAGDEKFIAVFRDQLVPAADRFKPDLVLISCGFDAHEGDLLGGMKVTDAGYGELTRIVRGIAEKHAKGRLVSVLEGGYNLDKIASASVAHVEALLAPPPATQPDATKP